MNNAAMVEFGKPTFLGEQAVSSSGFGFPNQRPAYVWVGGAERGAVEVRVRNNSRKAAQGIAPGLIGGTYAKPQWFLLLYVVLRVLGPFNETLSHQSGDVAYFDKASRDSR